LVLPGFSAMDKTKTNKKPKKNKNEFKKSQKKQDPTLCHYSPPWGVQYCCFVCVFVVFFVFCFCWFLVVFSFGFLGFLFSGSLLFFLKGWQNNTKVKDLDLTLCQFSHFRGCKLAFG
jgi:hypothetical protein